MARTNNYALRLLASLKAEAEKVAAEEGTTLNQFINVAVAEKRDRTQGQALGHPCRRAPGRADPGHRVQGHAGGRPGVRLCGE
jgi:hypothetical protein